MPLVMFNWSVGSLKVSCCSPKLARCIKSCKILEAIRHEIRTISFMNPGPLTSRLVDNINATAGASTTANGPQKFDEESTIVENGPKKSDEEITIVENGPKKSDEEITIVENRPQKFDKESKTVTVTPKEHNSRNSALSDMHSQAAAYARLAEMAPLKPVSVDREGLSELTDESGNIIVLPVSAESAGLLPKRKDKAKGSDIVLEAILEADVAKNAKELFSQPQSQLKSELLKEMVNELCTCNTRGTNQENILAEARI